jgi:hypothetical protein
MTNDKRDLLTVLKRELDFLEKGGYATPRERRGPQFVFQDSPSCLNFDPAQTPKLCSDCLLTQLAPENFRNRNIPCRYIQLSDSGATTKERWRHQGGDPSVMAEIEYLCNSTDFWVLGTLG